MQKSEFIRLNLAVIADEAISLILERHAFDLTICPECEEAEFRHDEDCTLAIKVEHLCEKLRDGEKLGPLVIVNSR